MDFFAALILFSLYGCKKACLDPEQEFPNGPASNPADHSTILRTAGLYPLKHCSGLLKAEGCRAVCARCEDSVS